MSEHAYAVKGDCANCAALCCIGLAIDKGTRFAIDKPAGVPCPNLDGHLCRIHADLDARGFGGCTAYDCQGAGQRVTQELFDGADWQDDPRLIAPMMDAFRDLRTLHQMLALLAVILPRLPEDDARKISDLAAPMMEPLTPATAKALATGPLPDQIKSALRAFPQLLRP
ncbi:hypothetical protein [Pseudoprimorskyibacter insulae]|uniref:Pentapeptide repeat-containing protein n=1 Tax=Pseudoprimorskyibacter insulae TaxID=1695997 RepID=A0A2R8AXH4_9RHOB|nr:hypothetical protein [Pseudoprimorskyibacter insulae]SPF80751.1 hypothetical protein PRI8871_02563 [Pseudoprimorskyibacter insulae]